MSAHGLAVALEQLAALAPVPVTLTVRVDGRLPEALEVAAYYLVSESLANVGKHARASSVTVEVARAGGVLRVAVTDDGVGGADTEAGSGLRGLADRDLRSRRAGRGRRPAGSLARRVRGPARRDGRLLAGLGRRVRDARLVFEKILTYANHLGLYSEEIGPRGELLGNFPQAFTHLALIRAAIALDQQLG